MPKKAIAVGTVLLLLICAGVAARRWVAAGIDELAQATKVSALLDVAVAVAPDDPNVYLARGAAGDVDKAIEVDPRCAEAYRRRAAGAGAGDVRAVEDWTRAIELERQPDDYLRRGRCYLVAHRYEDAQSDFEVAAKGCSAETLNAAAGSLVQSGKELMAQDAAMAVPLFRAAGTLAVGEEGTVSLKEAGQVLLANGQYGDAIKAFSKAIKFDKPQSDPQNNAYLWRSLAYEKMGDEIGAETDLVKANEQCGAQALDSWLTKNHWR